jgi:hypothetical protein
LRFGIVQILKAASPKLPGVSGRLQKVKGESFVKRVRVKSIAAITALLGAVNDVEVLRSKYLEAGYEFVREMKEGKFAV